MKKLTFILCLLSLSFANAFGEQATLKEFSGELKIVRLFKRLEPKVGMVLEAKDMLITKADGKAVVLLPDESTINVGPDSTLKLTKFFTPDANTRNVELELIEGAGIFAVTKKMEDSKFVVRTPTAVAGVRGTNFMVKHGLVGSHYRSSIAVFKGLVAVSPVRKQLEKEVKAVFLAAMTQSTVEAGKAPTQPSGLSKNDVQQIATEVGVSASSTGASASTAPVNIVVPVRTVNTPRPATIDVSKILDTKIKVDPASVNETIIKVVPPKTTIAPPPKQPTNPSAQ